MIRRFGEDLERDGNSQTLGFALEPFIQYVCPKCGSEGMYKWHFLGELRHPDCGWSWYAAVGTYIQRQLGSVFRAGLHTGGGMMDELEKKGESGGCLYAIVGFLFGSLFRLVFALLMIPVQAVVSLMQAKP